MTNEPCQFLEWDTDFFDRRIARVNGHQLDERLLESIYAWCENQAIECLYFLADSDDPITIRLAEGHNFSLVEIRLNMERSLKDWNPAARPRGSKDIHVRPTQPGDIPLLLEIARTSYVDSRFYFDACFPEDKWQSYYQTWVRKSCEGGADLALTAELNGEVVGYITGNVDKEGKEGIYELTGVKESARRAGVGQELFRSGLDWYVQKGVEYIWLATQGRNVSTQRMVQRDGFITRSCQIYYHKWFNPCPSLEDS